MNDALAIQRDALALALRRHSRCEVRFDIGSRHLYSTDASLYRVEPIGVALPRSVDDLRVCVQVAAENRVSIVPRGGGTSLSGQAIGAGLVVDCSKYLNKIIEFDAARQRVRVQPGVVLDQLNRHVASHGLCFGPDVATASRANIGGMLGNNSAGARSVVHGKTGDHVHSMDVLLSDGRITKFEPMSANEWARKAQESTLEGKIYHDSQAIVQRDAKEIRRRFPKLLRRVSGYNLEGLSRQLDIGTASLLPLLVGSEGTLGIVTEAELGLLRRPTARGLVVPHYHSLAAALDSLADCLEAGPSAVELLDSLLVTLAAENLALRDVMRLIHGRPASLLMVEISGDDQMEVASRVQKLKSKLEGGLGVTHVATALDDATRDLLWNLRSAGSPLLYGLHGARKPITFVEDAAVEPAKLPEFVARFREVLRKHGTDGAFYGHASVGCLHIRPMLDLRDAGDVMRMRQIMVDISDLVLSFGGSLSGEHGDGMVRSEWNRKMYGPVVYEAFRQIKHAFDPKNLFNPGKVVDGPSMTENLRSNPATTKIELQTVFDYSRQEGFFRSVELCNGAGVCRKLQGGTMCPSFRATHDEADSTRGRANGLRIALELGVDHPDQGVHLADRWLFDVMDLCLMCKACKAECPSNVDLQKLKSEFLNAYYDRHRRPMAHRFIGQIHRFNRLGSRFSRAAGWINKNRFARIALEWLAGVDRRRPLPTFHADDFRSWFDRREREVAPGRRVWLFDDCLTTYHEPQVGRAAVRVLDAAGYEVARLGMMCCGRAMISKGLLYDAKQLVRMQLPRLARLVADGTPILGIEPSCLLTLKDEWPDLCPGPQADAVAEAAHLADVWIGDEMRTGQHNLAFKSRNRQVLLHGHCHQRALCGIDGSATALTQVSGYTVRSLDIGCCGMAGSFGYERDHYDLSVKIATLELVPAIKREPDAIVAATGTSCRHQIRDLCHIEPKHPVELLADSIKPAD
jgi:FAD/FMN-containing dehydrogenase/Fe-S oxidoreductase